MAAPVVAATAPITDRGLLQAHAAQEFAAGRRLDAARPFDAVRAVSGVERGVVHGALSSALVRVGSSVAVCAVSGEAGPMDPSVDDAGRITFGVTLAPFCDGAKDQRDAVSARCHQAALFASELCARSAALPMEKLVLVPGEAAWVLRVDVRLLQLDGPVADVVVAAINAALEVIEVPAATLIDGSETAPVTLRRRCPLSAVTFGLVAHGEVLADPTAVESLGADGQVTVGLAAQNVVAVRHHGGYPCSTGAMRRAVEIAVRNASAV